MNKKNLYGIVGSGQMAKHFCHYLSLSDVSYVTWSRNADKGLSPFEKLQDAKVVLLLISDSAIASFLEQYPQLKKLNLVHFSGSVFLEGVPSYHPLMSFAKGLYSLQEYQKIPFIFEKGKPAFGEVFSELPNPSFALDKADKPLYHALCVLSGNFTVMLWQKVFREFAQRFSFSPKILLPYMHKICQNLSGDWEEALSGPLARGDEQTIAKNLKSLQGDAFADVYRAFVQTLEKGGKE